LRSHTRKLIVISAIAAFCAGITPAQTAKKSPSGKTGTAAHRRHTKSRKGAWKKHGQQNIQPDRAREIQEALIRERYLSGEPSGAWDTRTQEAMTRYQTDNGWQSKVTPDSRALIKLGLGPNYSDKDLLNLNPKAKPSSDAVAATGGGTTGTGKQR
jgi:hypothetical protein